jgi:hypothetical protein
MTRVFTKWQTERRLHSFKFSDRYKSTMDWCSVYLTPQALPKYIYLPDTRYDNVTLSPLLLPARVTNRSHSTYGSSAGVIHTGRFFCPNSVVSGSIRNKWYNTCFYLHYRFSIRKLFLVRHSTLRILSSWAEPIHIWIWMPNIKTYYDVLGKAWGVK